MKTRYELHEFLCEILGSRNVYFQPPESVKMKDPDSEVSKQLANILLCRLQQHFVSDNLNHDIFKIYY